VDDVAKPTGLTKRKNSNQWYVRVRCPKHLAGPGVPVEKWTSLDTADYKTALVRLNDAREATYRFFAAPKPSSTIIVSGPYRRWPDDPRLPVLDGNDVLGLVQSFFRFSLLQLDAHPHLRGALEPEALQRVAQEIERQIADLQAEGDEDEEDPTVSTAIGLLHQHGVRTHYASEPAQLLRAYLRRAMVQLLRIERSRLDGDFSVGSIDPLFHEISAQVPQSGLHLSAPSSHRLTRITAQDACDRYLAELLQTERMEKTADRYRNELKHVVSFFGPDKVMAELKRSDCIAFRNTFSMLPPNFSRLLKNGTSIREIATNRTADAPVLAWETLDKYLSALNRFLRWAYKEEYIERAWDDLSPLGKKPDGSMAKLPFEDAELSRIFSRPIYMGCLNDGHGFSRPGPNIVRRARYWAPLISLFGGLRAGEILQLTPDHFRRSPTGHPFIVLTPDMQLKNENAQREVPVHSILIAIGLLGWVERRRSDADAKLFPEIAPDAYAAESPTFSKRFKSDLKHFELGERRAKLTFHSFRHTFKRALDRTNASEQEKDELCGWARGKKTGRRYGVGLEADRLQPWVEAVAYDIDLNHLLSHSRLDD
jgi:integrase